MKKINRYWGCLLLSAAFCACLGAKKQTIAPPTEEMTDSEEISPSYDTEEITEEANPEETESEEFALPEKFEDAADGPVAEEMNEDFPFLPDPPEVEEEKNAEEAGEEKETEIPETMIEEEISPQSCLTNPLLCDDEDHCTADECDPTQGCLHKQISCDDADVCTTDLCETTIGCLLQPLDCDDGIACTEDSCQEGTGCVHTWVCPCLEDKDCDDGNPCTDDSCGADNKCVHLPNLFPCDDGNECTSNDLCVDEKCIGSEYDYSDGNICTDDSCNPVKGVIFTANAAPCDDGDACTAGDICNESVCLSGQALDCDDHNECTIDSCDPAAGCQHEAVVCDDGDACTSDFCDKLTGCKHLSIICDDDNQCTTDSCQPAKGCEYKTIICNDNNSCTDDSCDPKNGCVCAYNTAACDDGSICTLIDKCAEGKCVGSMPLDCDDSQECTLDLCHKTLGCQHSKLTSTACNDADPCTVSDTCQNGVCQAGTQTCECYTTADCAEMEDGNLCNGTPICDKMMMPYKCTTDPQTVVTCSTAQDTACSQNTCQPTSGKCEMAAVNEGDGCDDGNPCTENDACASGVCTGAAKPTGTVIWKDDFNNGNMNSWESACVTNSGPSCSLICSVLVTNEADPQIKVSPLCPAGQASLSSPILFLPKGGLVTLAFKINGPDCYYPPGICSIATSKTPLGDLNSLTPPCQSETTKQFVLPATETASHITISCSGAAPGKLGDGAVIYFDDFSLTCP